MDFRGLAGGGVCGDADGEGGAEGDEDDGEDAVWGIFVGFQQGETGLPEDAENLH